MSESSLKPFNGKLDENTGLQQQASLKPFEGEKQNKGIKGHLQDAGLAALKGAIAVPEIAVGIMDTMSDGAVGKTLENKNGAIGFRPREAKQALSDLHTDQYKAQQQEFADAGKDGDWADKVIDKTKVALTNPSLIANTVVESVPSMLAGGVLGRASGIANPVVAGAVGEGAVMAGSQAEQIRQETVDGRLTADQSLAGATTGVLGGLIGFAGGRIAQKLGIGDVDTMLVNGKLGPAEIAGEIAAMPAKSLPRRVVEGAISEGFLEELPQSVSEQILQNLALDKPWSDGIEDAAVMGTLAGMAMGGAANILSGHNTGTEPQNNQQQSGTPNLPFVPPQLGSGPDNAMSGEYIPRENAPQGDNQGRTAFVYDQPSMDADNLLSNNYEGDADFNTSGNLDPSNNPLSPSGGNYFEDYSTQPQLPSEHLGINPNDGPMSSAAALAVDSGTTSSMMNAPTVEAEQANVQDNSNTTLSNAVPSSYQSLLGSNNDAIGGSASEFGQSKGQDTSNFTDTNQVSNLRGSEDAQLTLEANSKNTEIQIENNTASLHQLEQQFADAKSVPLKAKIRKQIYQLKSSQNDSEVKPLVPEQIQTQYGDMPESVMSDIQILGDDFTVDLRDEGKKSNALNNPNYNAVKKSDGSVEIIGMKHPATGEWVGKKPSAINIDENAQQAATSAQNNTPSPTQAQIEAGNYKKGHIKVHGLDIAIENPRGSERSGTDPDGKTWSHKMSDHYGYIKRTTGADNEHIDTYVGNSPESEQVYIVDQIDQKTGGFDEHKVMMGFNSKEDAIQAYSSNFDKGWKVGPVKEMSKDQFKDWLKKADTSKPATNTNLKESIENIRAEKIRQKDIADMHNSVYGLASDEQLQESLKYLNKEISKAQKQSENQVVSGKRSTRKATSAGAVDRFLKNRIDLETYIKARKNGEVKQRSKKTSGAGKSKNQNKASKKVPDTHLYSRSRESSSGSTVQQVREILIDRFGEDTIAELERQGKLEIIQDYQVEGVEGFYYNGKAVLVASNLTAESTVPTFLHELGGHAGFQNMMNQKQYNELMNQFNKLVEQGNPVALAAKMLAEREQGSERQQLEYLPYLLTLSSTMQQRNVIQRNALQKLINNIVSYVKAWVFDNFGINLNLNHDDILALSERMIGQIKHQSSLDLIRQKYHGTSQWMTAPNGAKTHLSEQQWLQVRTPEFKKWFGDWENDAANASQVLDENGEPKVVYHGTATEFNEFTQGHGLLGDGIYLTDSFDTADMYANIRGNNGFVLPLFVNIRNAFKTTGNVSRDKVVEATKSGKYQGVVHQFENHEYIVALEPNQVKIAVGNTGTFNSESSDIRFSRSSNYEDITNRISKGFKNLPKAGDLINKAGDLINKKGVDWLSIGLGLLSRRHLTEVYGKLLPQLNKYNELAAQMDADKNDIAAEADNIVREWSKLKDEEALANIMHDATLAQIDPAKPYQQGDNKVKYQQLLHAYNKLSPEAQVMYKKARNAYSGHYAKVREAIRERILRSALSSQKKADLLKNIEGSFGQIKGVYFPLARFGKYVVVMRNQNGQAEVISRAETMNEAEYLRNELMLKYPQFKADDVKKDAKFSASRDVVGRGFMSDLFDEVGNLGLDKKAQADFEDTLSQLYLSSMPDLSWAKHGIHRKGTAGFSQDARRAFAQHMFSGANYLGKLRYGDQLAQQLDEMKKYSEEEFKKGIGYDQRTARSVIDEMEERHTLLMNPKGHPISSVLTSVGFMYYMGLSPAAAMVNLSQTALIAYPLMGAKWNYDKAGKELLKASSDFAKGVEFNVPDFSSLESFKNSFGDAYSPNIDKILKGLELDAYNEAVKRGVIDVTQAHDLAGIAQGEDSKVMWYFRPAMRLASGMFHHAERFNREVTFIAAYRLATKAGASQSEAFEQGMDMVYRGHFDYSTGNRARFMQGNVAKVLLLFKQYAQNMIYTLVRNAHQSIYALDPKEQREARRALAGILGMHALAAGAIGLPITWMLATASILIAKKSKLGAAAFGIAAAAAFASGGDDDDPYKLENVIRNWLSDIHPKFADLVFGGVPRAFSPVDLSGRVGLNNLIIPDVQDGLEGADWAKAMQSALLGPVVGISTNAVKGMQEINNGDYGRGIETMLPVVLKNAMKSMRFANEGVLTKNKDVIQEEVGTVGLFSQAIGFSPSDVKTSMEGRSAIYDYKTKLENHRKDLMRQWVVAKRDDDSEGMDKAWAEILKFNENVSEKNPSMQIKRINLMQSYKSNERRSKDTGDGGVYLTKRQKGAEEQGGFAFNRQN